MGNEQKSAKTFDSYLMQVYLKATNVDVDLQLQTKKD